MAGTVTGRTWRLGALPLRPTATLERMAAGEPHRKALLSSLSLLFNPWLSCFYIGLHRDIITWCGIVLTHKCAHAHCRTTKILDVFPIVATAALARGSCSYITAAPQVRYLKEEKQIHKYTNIPCCCQRAKMFAFIHQSTSISSLI